MELNGRIVLVTGAARGMGRMEALSFARAGSRVIVTDVDEAALSETVREMKDIGHHVHSYMVDVSDREACFELARKVREEVGALDVLVNNAGIVVCEEVLNLQESDLRRMMDVNYFGMVWMMQAFVPAMVLRGSGHVVNMCSSAGKVGVPRLGGYCATKFAAIGVTDSIRPELRKSGVNFTIVNPGYVNTGMFGGSKVPLITRWQKPGRVADAIVKAVRENKAEICVPSFAVRFATFWRGLCVPKFTDWISWLLGAHRSFGTWKKDESRPF